MEIAPYSSGGSWFRARSDRARICNQSIDQKRSERASRKSIVVKLAPTSCGATSSVWLAIEEVSEWNESLRSFREEGTTV